MAISSVSNSGQIFKVEQVSEFYPELKERYDAGERISVPKYLLSLFKKTPHYFLQLNANTSCAESIFAQREELPDEVQARVVLSVLKKMMTMISKEMKEEGHSEITFTPVLSDGMTYTIKCRRVAKYFLRPWLANQGLQLAYSQETFFSTKRTTIVVSPQTDSKNS